MRAVCTVRPRLLQWALHEKQHVPMHAASQPAAEQQRAAHAMQAASQAVLHAALALAVAWMRLEREKISASAGTHTHTHTHMHMHSRSQTRTQGCYV